MKLKSIICIFLIILAVAGLALNTKTERKFFAKANTFLDRKIFINFDGKISRGTNLLEILKNAGVSDREARKAIFQFSERFNPQKIKFGKSYHLRLNRFGELFLFQYKADRRKIISVYRTSDSNFASRIDSLELKTKAVYLSGFIQSSLYDAVLQSGEKPELLLNFADIFQWDIDFFTDPRLGDKFEIFFEKKYLADSEEFFDYGKILFASYQSRKKIFKAYFFENDSVTGYFDEEGQRLQKTFLKSPLNYSRISSRFSLSRRHPILKIYRPHYGIDYAAPSGTPVVATASGTVIEKGYQRQIGNYVKIRHKNRRFTTIYGHLKKFARGIRPGVSVEQRKIIGYVGKTGLATGPHLHYGVYDRGRPIDPMKIENAALEPLTGAVLKIFREHVQKIDGELSLAMIKNYLSVHARKYSEIHACQSILKR